MKDRLEKFVEAHRPEFDDLEPRKDLWKQIQAELPKKKNSDYTWLWKVAAAVFLCVSVVLVVERSFQPNEIELADSITQDALTPSEELEEVEGYYTHIIAQKRSEIQLVISTRGLTDIDLLQDLDQLDEMYDGLRGNLEQNQNDERLINAMIRNLQLRVEILNKQLKILEQINKFEDEKVSV